MSTLTLFFIIVLICTAAMFLERAASWLAHVSGLSVIILTALILSSLGVIPHQSPLYDFFTGKAVLVAMALVIFSFRFKDLIDLPGRIWIIYLIGFIGTIAGGLLVIWVFYSFLGVNAIKLGSQLTASYIGGAENDVAMKHALAIPNDLFTSVFTVDNIITSLWMILTLFLAGKNLPPDTNSNSLDFLSDDNEDNAANVFSILFSILAALFALILANSIYSCTQFISPVLYLTIIALGFGQVPQFRKWLAPSYQMGCILFIFFFFAIGATSNVNKIAQLPIGVILMPLIVVLIHGAIIFTSARLLKIPFLETAVASQALIGGPSTALALCLGKNWKKGVSMALLLGLLGYCVANFMEIMMFKLLMFFYR